MFDTNANAASQARAGLTGLADFLYRQSVEKPRVKAETKKLEAEAKTADIAARQQELMFNLWKQNIERAMQPPSVGPVSDETGGGGFLGTPRVSFGEADKPLAPPVSNLARPDLGRMEQGLAPVPATSPAQGSGQALPAVSPAPTTQGPVPRVGLGTTFNERGELVIAPGPIGDSLKRRYDKDPTGTMASADPLTQQALERYEKSKSATLQTATAAARLPQAQLEAAFGTPEERKRFVDFSSGAEDAARLLEQLDEIVGKFGNYESMSKFSPLSNKQAAGLLHALPLQISDALNKVINPGMALQEGQVRLQKEYNIPLPENFWQSFQIAPEATMEGINSVREVLASRIRTLENAPDARLPVMGLTPEMRALVGPTKMSLAYEAEHGQPVPTNPYGEKFKDVGRGKPTTLPKLPGVHRPVTKPGAASVAPPDTAAQGNGSVTGSAASAGGVAASRITTKEQYDRLEPGTPYIDALGNLRTKGGARNVPNLGSTAGASH